jgi:hypothetical protein
VSPSDTLFVVKQSNFSNIVIMNEERRQLVNSFFLEFASSENLYLVGVQSSDCYSYLKSWFEHCQIRYSAGKGEVHSNCPFEIG